MIQFIGRAKYNALKPLKNLAAFPEYRSVINSASVGTQARCHNFAYRNTVNIPLNIKFHHIQFPAIPFIATIPVIASGVSAANVVATMEMPAAHHGISLPPMK